MESYLIYGVDAMSVYLWSIESTTHSQSRIKHHVRTMNIKRSSKINATESPTCAFVNSTNIQCNAVQMMAAPEGTFTNRQLLASYPEHRAEIMAGLKWTLK